MKKILFLLLVTISGYGQTLNNPTFGNTTTNTIKVKTNSVSTTALDVGVLETDGSLNKMTPTNLSIPQVPLNYMPSATTVGGHLQGIDTKLGAIVATTAGITTRVWFTADVSVVSATNYYATNATSKGTIASAIQNVVNNDNVKTYYAQDLIGNAFATATMFPPGVYAGNLSASTTPNSAQQRWTVELYKCNNAGTPIASGVTGAPVGSLGVTVITILDSGLLTLVDGSVTNVQVSGNLGGTGLSMAVGERIRYHVSAEKVGTAGANITQSVYYGTSYNSFIDVPVPLNTSAVVNLSTVSGATTTDALNTLNTGKANDSDVLHKTGNESFSGLKSATNTTYPASSGIKLINSNNSGVLNNSDAAVFQIVNSQNSMGSHISNTNGGIGFYGENAGNGVLNFADNTGSTGVLNKWQSKTGNTGDLLQLVKNGGILGGINHESRLMSLYSSTRLDGGAAAAWLTLNGTSTYGGGMISSIAGVEKAYYYYDNGYAVTQGGAGVGVKVIVNGGTIAVISSSTGEVTVPNLAGTGVRQVVTDASGKLSATTPQPLKYVALLSQSGTSAPTATVLENTLGGTVVWSYTSSGRYTGTLTGAFTLNKTVVLCTRAATGSGVVFGGSNEGSVNSVVVGTNNSSGGVDSLLTSATVEIRVYP